MDQLQKKAATPAMDDACGQVLREDALCSSNKNGDSTHILTQAQSSDAGKGTDPRVGPFKSPGDNDSSTVPALPSLEVNQGSTATVATYDDAHGRVIPIKGPKSDPPVDYDDTSGIDRRRFYIPQPNDYSCAPTSLTEACFDFNASGGDTGLHFDGATFADPNSREAMRHGVERTEEEPEKDFGSIDDEARYAGKFGLSTKLHFDPDSGVSITSANVNQAMTELDGALAAGHGAIVNVPHHFVYCAGKTPDGQYIMGDPADSRTSLWNSWRMSNEMDHQYDPFNDNRQWTPTGFVEVWNPNKPVHDHIVSLGYPRFQLPETSVGIPWGQYQSQRKR